MGRADNGVTLAEALTHMRAIAGRVDIPVNADFEGGFAIEPEAVGVNVASAATHRRRRTLNRGLHGRPLTAAVRFRALGRTRACRASRTRRQRELRRPHRPFRRLHRRAAGPGRNRPASCRVRRGRGRLPLRARHPGDRGHRRHCAGRRAQAGERAGGQRLHDCVGPGRARRSAHQRWRCPGPRGVGRLSDGRDRNCRARDIRWPLQGNAFCGAESAASPRLHDLASLDLRP